MLYCSRLLNIGILLLVLSFFSNGQEPCDSTVIKKEQLGLDEIIVTAERTPVQSHFAGRIVGIISSEDIKIIPAQCFGDLLEYEPGIDLRQRGSIGVQIDAGICGSSFEQILILLNGINLNDPQTGHHNMNLPVDPGDISRIEILKGSGSRSFGTNAFGGVVNIITKLEKQQKPQLTSQQEILVSVKH